jgi:hypothetical protein
MVSGQHSHQDHKSNDWKNNNGSCQEQDFARIPEFNFLADDRRGASGHFPATFHEHGDDLFSRRGPTSVELDAFAVAAFH